MKRRKEETRAQQSHRSKKGCFYFPDLAFWQGSNPEHPQFINGMCVNILQLLQVAGDRVVNENGMTPQHTASNSEELRQEREVETVGDNWFNWNRTGQVSTPPERNLKQGRRKMRTTLGQLRCLRPGVKLELEEYQVYSLLLPALQALGVIKLSCHHL